MVLRIAIAPLHGYGVRSRADRTGNVGTGYFGCRNPDGTFNPDMFKENAARPQVKMIELKLSQGAKPGHGGILPFAKLTPAIAEARGIDLKTWGTKDVDSPPSHKAFKGPHTMMLFIQQLRELSGGKPIGFKMCVGDPTEIAAVVHAMVDLDIYPDFITVDGGEGGTGAAPPEFSNSIGTPLVEGLYLVNSLLEGAAIREKIKIIVAGKVLSGFSLVRCLALGADVCNAARAMMFALGCVQALKCNTNKCPTGVATQEPHLMQGLVVEDKARRVANYQQQTIKSAMEIVGAVSCACRRWRYVRTGVTHAACSDAGVLTTLDPSSLRIRIPRNCARRTDGSHGPARPGAEPHSTAHERHSRHLVCGDVSTR